MGEQHNLKDEQPGVTAELCESAAAWRSTLEDRWESYWLPLSKRSEDKG